MEVACINQDTWTPSHAEKSYLNPILSVRHLTKIYQNAGQAFTVLKDVSFTIQEGSSCAIVGPSGNGKTTLLGLCAGLDRPTSGSVVFNGIALAELDEEELAQLRNQYIGFVFQTFQLIPTLSALENVMVPVELRGETRSLPSARRLLERVGLEDRLHNYPVQLSGGEQQRVALARAFISNPKILFADEPTGNLDTGTSRLVQQLLLELNEENNTTLILATHNQELAGCVERIIRLKGGTVAFDNLNHAGSADSPIESAKKG